MNDPAILRMTYPDAQLRAAGRTYQVLTAVQSPNIVVLGGFLDEDTCRDLIDLARPRMKRSSVVHHAEGVRIDETRTSSGCHFRRGEMALVADIEQRIAELTGIPPENGEGLQVLHYLPGQHYVPHWDYFPPESPSSADMVRPEKGGQRVATFIAYLNTVPFGGETEFPRAGVKVAAVQGNACFFSYRTADGQPDPLTLHSGNAVIDGEKWIAVKWLREGRYPE
ncbi:2OG-Fe(II) oxygenase [Ralstonia solanacearum]|uniref:2OG-Fe(II) oxygenase n=1 Tax=Ralstonia solanacearum TaxID=305 RepID=UPI000B2A3AFC|nr:2OG-Fe(II) oxygenase [Ralstonia solanacearum]MCL9826610.1 2OG-Fe(II) oxygenase [Ralstonia solanacearum]MCL9831440.1 2OG-Fe(II) oxygenase [Ralstonia solanacearum]MCL9836221.1 2OG-Fe(II) oxygenase [Ralstonia solanacearum]